MPKQCKNCHADMPEEANICLECLTLCEEKQTAANIQKFTSGSKNSAASFWISALVWLLFGISAYIVFSGISINSAKLTPASQNPISTYDSETQSFTNETSDNTYSDANTVQNNYSADNKQNGNTQNVSAIPNQSVLSTEQNSSSSSNQQATSTTVSPSKTLNLNNKVISDIKVNPNPTTQNSNTNSTTENSTTSFWSGLFPTKPTTSATTKPNTTASTAKPNTTSGNNTISSKPNTTVNTPKPSTTKPNENTTAGTTQPEPEYDKFEYYKDSDGRMHISKYTGNAKDVVVPDRIDGLNVYQIDSGAFKDNSNIQTITFKDSTQYHTLWVSTYAIENCSALKTVTFPLNTDLGILMFCQNCPNLSKINIDNWQYQFTNGGLYYYNTNMWQLYYYCEGYPSSEFRAASYYRGSINSNLFTYNTRVKRIYLDDANYLTGFYSTSTSNKYIEGVYVDKNNKHQFDVDGVVFD